MNLRDYERESIRAFVQKAADAGYLSGRVLDYGCGRQPYRDIVEAAGGDYQAFDAPEHPGNVGGERYTPNMPHVFDAVLCTQVLQYVPQPFQALRHMRSNMVELNVPKPYDRHLVLTYPTNWPEVEPEDLHRFTKAGMERLLTEAGFAILLHERRGTLYDARFPSGREKRITATADEFAIGYGVVARA